MARNSPPLRSTTGIQGLDDVLHGGLIAGSLYLLEGNPGAGKTTLALQYLREGVRLGEACLYVTLSETAEELVAGASSHGWELKGVRDHRADRRRARSRRQRRVDDVPPLRGRTHRDDAQGAGCGGTVAAQFVAAAAARGDHATIFTFEESRQLLLDRCAGLGIHLREGTEGCTITVRRIDPAEVSPGQFAQLVRHAVEVDSARVVVIDSLNGYMNAMPEDRALTVQPHELLSYLNNHGVATFLIAAHAGQMGPNLRNPIDASYLADAVVRLRMYEHQGQVKKAISVLKKRSGRHEESVRQIWFDQRGLHLSDPLLHLRGLMTAALADVAPPAASPAPRMPAGDA